MSKKDYYQVLEVKKTATSDELKKAYRKLSKTHHPDAGGDAELFKEVAEAYEILSNPEKRAHYDNFGHDRPQHQQRYRQYQKPVIVGENMVLNITLSLEEIYNGIKKKFKYNRDEKCDSCGGHGGSERSDCYTCGGTGFETQVIQTPIGYMQHMGTCRACYGTGSTYLKACDSCKSSGLKNIEETIEIDIPSGVQEGMTFINKGKGHGVKGGECGDLHIRILEAKHNIFTRNGSDLKMNLKLSYTQLILGDKVEIYTIDGSKIRITIPEYSDVGTNLKVQGKGLKTYNKEHRGDILITLGIIIPKNINDEKRELLEKLKNTEENFSN